MPNILQPICSYRTSLYSSQLLELEFAKFCKRSILGPPPLPHHHSPPPTPQKSILLPAFLKFFGDWTKMSKIRPLFPFVNLMWGIFVEDRGWGGGGWGQLIVYRNASYFCSLFSCFAWNVSPMGKRRKKKNLPQNCERIGKENGFCTTVNCWNMNIRNFFTKCFHLRQG